MSASRLGLNRLPVLGVSHPLKAISRHLSTNAPNCGIDYELWPSLDDRDFFSEVCS